MSNTNVIKSAKTNKNMMLTLVPSTLERQR